MKHLGVQNVMYSTFSDGKYLLVAMYGRIYKGQIVKQIDNGPIPVNSRKDYYHFYFNDESNMMRAISGNGNTALPSMYSKEAIEVAAKYNCKNRLYISNDGGRLVPSSPLLTSALHNEKDADKVYAELVENKNTLAHVIDGFLHIRYEDNSLIINQLCAYKPHPDCCGANILYAFTDIDTLTTDENYASFREMLDQYEGASKIAHIAEYQEEAAIILEKVGFNVIYRFTNLKSNNEISIYQLDADNRHEQDDDEDDEDDY